MNIIEKHNLNLQIKGIDSLRSFDWNSSDLSFILSVDFGRIESIEFIDDIVLLITFDNGELRLDLNKSEINQINEEQFKNKTKWLKKKLAR